MTVEICGFIRYLNNMGICFSLGENFTLMLMRVHLIL